MAAILNARFYAQRMTALGTCCNGAIGQERSSRNLPESSHSIPHLGDSRTMFNRLDFRTHLRHSILIMNLRAFTIHVVVCVFVGGLVAAFTPARWLAAAM
jgi:hypothetical protein